MAKKQKKKDKKYNECAFIDLEDRLYLAVREGDDFYFAHLDPQTGEIVLSEEVTINGKTYVPLKPSMSDDNDELPIYYPSPGIVDAEIVDTQEVYNRIKHHIVKYVDLPPDSVELSAFYDLFTWFYRKSTTAAYLRFIGDTGKGKTRMLKVVGDLSFYPLETVGTATRSAIMRIQENLHGTLILDEADFKGDKHDEMIKYLNAGFEKGKRAILSNTQNPDVVHSYDAFSPKIFAMREPFHDSATEGRLLSISPYETNRADIPPVLPRRYDKEVKVLRDTIAAWTLRNWSGTDGEMIELVSQLPVEPRLKQLAASLSVILPLFGNTMNNKFIEWILNRQRKVAEQREGSPNGVVFNAIADITTGIIKGKDLSPELQEYFVTYEFSEDPDGNGKIIAITSEMLSDITRLYMGRVGALLKGMHFSTEHYITVKNGERKKRARVIYIEDTKRWVEGWRKYRAYEPMIEVPEILKDPRVNYDSILEHLQPPTEMEIRILSDEISNAEPVPCKVLEKFAIYSQRIGKDVLLPIGTVFRCPRDLAEQLKIAGKVQIMEVENDE